MRLFIALALPAEVRAELAAQQDDLRASLGHDGRAVRWTDVEALHLTLCFLGESDESLVGSILPIVAQSAPAIAPLSLRLERAGAFPNARRPQTLWCGVGGDLHALGAAQRRLAEGLEPLGFAADKRRYAPHLTLGRVRREASSAQVAAIGAALGALASPSPLSWRCGPTILFQSTLTPNGSIYTPLSSSERELRTENP